MGVMKKLTDKIKKQLCYRGKHPLYVTGINDYVVIDMDEKELKEWSLLYVNNRQPIKK